jgi:hypothetical protein
MKKGIVLVLLIMMLSGCSIPNPVAEVTKTTTSLSNLQYSMFEGNVPGSTVKTATSMLANDDISIYIRTGVNKQGFFAQTKGCYKLKEDVAVPSKDCHFISKSMMENQEDQNYYISTMGKPFVASQFKNEAGEIKLILLEQK